MNIAIRVDAGTAIGGGHLMRCLALADELAQHGCAIHFVTRADDRPWGELLRMHGHRVTQLAGPMEHWSQDLAATRAVLAGQAVDWLVVDHYSFDRDWEQGMRPHVRRILAVDDLARRHDCDILLDQNVLDDKDAYRALVPAGCRRLLGPRYALLRGEFAAAQQRAAGDRVRNVVIGFGAGDPTGETGKAIDGFLAADLSGARAHIIVGAANLRAEELRRRYGGQSRLEFHTQPQRVSELLAAADLAVGAGGIGTWERACLGVPSIVISVADNQTAIAETLAVRGGHCYLGRSDEVDAQRIATSLTMLAHNAFLRTLFSTTGRTLCDGRGTRRAAAALRSSAVALRRATAADGDALYAWRNAGTVRRWSGNAAPVDRLDHDRWLRNVLEDNNRHLLIGEDDAGAVGVVRYDVRDRVAEVSIYLVPERIGTGAGAGLLAAGQAWLAGHIPAVGEIRARVRHGNAASSTMFENAGYRLAEHEFRLSLDRSREAS